MLGLTPRETFLLATASTSREAVRGDAQKHSRRTPRPVRALPA